MIKNSIIGILAVISVFLSGYILMSSKNTSQNAVSSVATTTSQTEASGSVNSTTSPEMLARFGMSSKLPGTKLFYSDELGIGFTLKTVPVYADTFGETKAFVQGKNVLFCSTWFMACEGDTVSVYRKDVSETLIDAVKRLGESYDTNFNKDCKVVRDDWFTKDGYEAVSVESKVSTDLDFLAACMMNMDGTYIMNKSVPTKFVGVIVNAKEGFDISDGTEKKKGYTGAEYIHDYYNSWMDSLQIVK